MRITDVRTMRLEGPDAHGIGGVARTWSVLLVRVDTDAGLYGLGEAPDFFGVVAAIAHARDWLLGRDPWDIRPFVRTMLYGGLPPFNPQMSPTACPTGPIAWGTSGVEMALCDLAGKASGVPVYRLLGGGYRDRVRVYLDRSGVDDPTRDETWRDLAKQVRDEGFDNLKFDAEWVAAEVPHDTWNRRLGASQIERIAHRLGMVREVVGSEVDITLDAHWSLDLDSACRLARALEPLDLMWFEDPLPMLDVDGYAQVRASTSIPICAGEMFLAEQFRDLFARDAVDIAHPDVLMCGGLHEAHRIGDLADLHSRPLALHNNGSGLATVAAAHVAAATPNFLGLEYHFFDAPWLAAVIRRDEPLFEVGHVPLSDAPGLGIELDAEVCRAHLAAGSALF